MKIAGATIERRNHGQNVAEFDMKIVVGRIPVVLGLTPAAVIESEHPPRAFAVLRQRTCQRLEVGRGARQARQADHRQSRPGRLAIAHDVQPQAVGRRDD